MAIYDHLTLSDAIKQDRIGDFVAQEERRGVSPVDRKKLEALIEMAALIKEAVTTPMQSKGRTSRSASRDGSNGK